MGTTSVQAWFEVHDPDGRTAAGSALYRFCGEVDGIAFEFDEQGSFTKGTYELIFTGDPEKMARYVVLFLVGYVAIHASEELTDLGVEHRDDGSVRVASLSMFRDFEHRGAVVDDADREGKLKRALVARFRASGVVSFKKSDGKYWFRLATRRDDGRPAPELVRAIVTRLRARKVDAPPASAGDPFGQMLQLLNEILERVRTALGPPPQDGKPDDALVLLRRANRWLTRALDALRSTKGRIALLHLFLAIAFGSSRATMERIRELYEALPSGILELIKELAEEEMEEARRAALRDLCLDALMSALKGRVPKKITKHLASATLLQLRRALLRTIDVRALAATFQASAATAAKPQAGRSTVLAADAKLRARTRMREPNDKKAVTRTKPVTSKSKSRQPKSKKPSPRHGKRSTEHPYKR